MPSSLTTNDAVGCGDERPLPRGRGSGSQGSYRTRVSSEAFRRVSNLRRIAPAPHQCHICSDTFTRADGLQSKSWELSNSLI